MIHTPSTVAERVAAGAAWLDEHEPGWETLMNVLDLDMSVGCRCVLGQLYAAAAEDSNWEDGFSHGVAAHDISSDQCIALGFDTHPLGPVNEFAALTAEWRRVITARRAVTG
jgi:hypothetical protein